jgi:putative tryptophan/tyrosine transport system substrate-binding protein
MFEDLTSVHDGGLISYGPSTADDWARAAYFIDRIMKGTPPSELPIEQPSVYRLVVNVRTAKKLGINIPQSIVMRADEVIR